MQYWLTYIRHYNIKCISANAILLQLSKCFYKHATITPVYYISGVGVGGSSSIGAIWTSRGNILHTRNRHLRTSRGLSVAFSNGFSVARSDGISLFGGILQRTVTCCLGSGAPIPSANTMAYNILYYTILYYTLLIIYYTILYYTILYYTILYYTILYYTILYYTIRD